MGRRAVAFFEQYGIEAVTGVSSAVRHALERYLGGELRGVQPCRESIEHAHREYEQDEVGHRSAEASTEAQPEGRSRRSLREEAEMLRCQLDEVMARLEKLDAS